MSSSPTCRPCRPARPRGEDTEETRRARARRGVHGGSIRAVDYARSLGVEDTRAVTFALDADEAREVGEEWRGAGLDVPLDLSDAPYRDIGAPLLAYVRELTADPDTVVNVVMPEVVVRGWARLLHNQRALYIKRLLLFEPHVILSSVPYQSSARTTTVPRRAEPCARLCRGSRRRRRRGGLVRAPDRRRAVRGASRRREEHGHGHPRALVRLHGGEPRSTCAAGTDATAGRARRDRALRDEARRPIVTVVLPSSSASVRCSPPPSARSFGSSCGCSPSRGSSSRTSPR